MRRRENPLLCWTCNETEGEWLHGLNEVICDKCLSDLYSQKEEEEEKDPKDIVFTRELSAMMAEMQTEICPPEEEILKYVRGEISDLNMKIGLHVAVCRKCFKIFYPLHVKFRFDEWIKAKEAKKE